MKNLQEVENIIHTMLPTKKDNLVIVLYFLRRLLNQLQTQRRIIFILYNIEVNICEFSNVL